MPRTLNTRYNVPILKRAYDLQHLTARELGKKARVSPSTVHRTFRKNSANARTIGKMARALGIGMDDLLFENERKTA
jgi:transcriptional regulator with XRE-family HTH domain